MFLTSTARKSSEPMAGELPRNPGGIVGHVVGSTYLSILKEYSVYTNHACSEMMFGQLWTPAGGHEISYFPNHIEISWAAPVPMKIYPVKNEIYSRDELTLFIAYIFYHSPDRVVCASIRVKSDDHHMYNVFFPDVPINDPLMIEKILTAGEIDLSNIPISFQLESDFMLAVQSMSDFGE